MITTPELVVAVVVLGLFIFVPVLRRLLGLIIRLGVFLIAVGIAAAGVTMILNNETIFEKPGFGQRVDAVHHDELGGHQHHGLQLGDLRPGGSAAASADTTCGTVQACRQKTGHP